MLGLALLWSAVIAALAALDFWGTCTGIGGVSVSVPGPDQAMPRTALLVHIAGYGVIWLLGMFGLRIARERLQRHLCEAIQTQKALRDSETRLSTVLDGFQIHLWAFDGSVYTYVNKQWFDFTGHDRAGGLTFELWSSALHPDDRAKATGVWLAHWQSKSEHDNYFRLLRHDGVYRDFYCHALPVYDEQGVFQFFQGFDLDITERKTAEDQLQYLAFYDSLTGLPNRRLVIDRLQQALAASTRHLRQGALLFFDLDNFKNLNEALGHDQGDQVLKGFANRLNACMRDGDTPARVGADEFIVLLDQLDESPLEALMQAEAVGNRILDALKQPYQIGAFEISCTASVGITLFGDLHEDPVEPVKRAELAMYQAKAHGRNTLRFFDPRMQSVVNERVALETCLREAIGSHQFVLHYQAQVSEEGQITGVEALLRWQHPKRGLVSPSEFIPLAEETGLILPIGAWVLESACQQLVQWEKQPAMAHLTIAVNVSARQFHQRDFADQVLSTLHRSGANPSLLKLELTESVLVTDVEGVIAKMSAIKARGVSFSLDDFGTGYSSLSYLKRLPMDQLKIDQGFVHDILTDSNDAAIARMVVALANSMGLMVIAEGVETEAQRDFLVRLGCCNCQGYLFSKPLPLEEFETYAKGSKASAGCVQVERARVSPNH